MFFPLISLFSISYSAQVRFSSALENNTATIMLRKDSADGSWPMKIKTLKDGLLNPSTVMPSWPFSASISEMRAVSASLMPQAHNVWQQLPSALKLQQSLFEES